MRITVRRVLEILSAYPDRNDFFREYPFLEEADLAQVLHYAAASVDVEWINLHRTAELIRNVWDS
jgi:uncharacterized protein (DUF433 family)